MSTISFKKSVFIPTAAVAVVVVFGLGFLTSYLVMPKAAAPRGNMAAYGGGASGFGQGSTRSQSGRVRGAGFVTGSLLKKDATSMTVQTRDGSTKLILVTSSTKAMQMADTTIDQFNQGSNVMVNGTANSDGSITAQTVQLMPVPAQAQNNGQPNDGQPAGNQPGVPTATPPGANQ